MINDERYKRAQMPKSKKINSSIFKKFRNTDFLFVLKSFLRFRSLFGSLLRHRGTFLFVTSLVMMSQVWRHDGVFIPAFPSSLRRSPFTLFASVPRSKRESKKEIGSNKRIKQADKQVLLIKSMRFRQQILASRLFALYSFSLRFFSYFYWFI